MPDASQGAGGGDLVFAGGVRLAGVALDAGGVGVLADGTDLEALTSWAKEQEPRGLTLVLAPHRSEAGDVAETGSAGGSQAPEPMGFAMARHARGPDGFYG
ncbi:hypothetical protein GCM10022232_09600 [Streptomyces plumbiresistens]|uniref:Uncharacterized protein n=1 Tax=Streptomyces plumbiresistens TaxID=511811 RepID=A0ABP7QBB2_9ACTN